MVVDVSSVMTLTISEGDKIVNKTVTTSQLNMEGSILEDGSAHILTDSETNVREFDVSTSEEKVISENIVLFKAESYSIGGTVYSKLDLGEDAPGSEFINNKWTKVTQEGLREAAGRSLGGEGLELPPESESARKIQEIDPSSLEQLDKEGRHFRIIPEKDYSNVDLDAVQRQFDQTVKSLEEGPLGKLEGSDELFGVLKKVTIKDIEIEYNSELWLDELGWPIKMETISSLKQTFALGNKEIILDFTTSIIMELSGHNQQEGIVLPQEVLEAKTMKELFASSIPDIPEGFEDLIPN